MPLFPQTKVPWTLAVLLAILLLAACAPTSDGPFRNYYVSLEGDDSAGDGSEGNPWRHIQYALDNADYSGDVRVVIHIGPGRFVENLNVTRSVNLQGSGAGHPLDEWGEVTDILAEETPGDGAPWHTISEDLFVEIRDLVFNQGRVEVQGGSLTIENTWFWDVRGLFGLRLINVGAFTIRDCTFDSQALSDLGIQAQDSTGEILGGHFGDAFDHPISINRLPSSGPQFVTVDGVTIEGSAIQYADGIRVLGDPQVTITNNTITRTRPDAEDWVGHTDRVAAGIGIQRVYSAPSARTDVVSGNTIVGFDVGISLDIGGMRIKLEDNDIAADSYDVRIWPQLAGRSARAEADIDFGGGSEGSAGGNHFQGLGDYAFYNGVDYDVYACDNHWDLLGGMTQDDLIYDQDDDSSLGNVIYGCSDEAIESEEEPEERVEIYTATPDEIIATISTDAFCRMGPGTNFEDSDFFEAQQKSVVYGRDPQGYWYLLQGPSTGQRCWVGQAVLDFNVPAERLDEVQIYYIGTPTATEDPDESYDTTPTPSKEPKDPTPSATATCYYDQQQNYICP